MTYTLEHLKIVHNAGAQKFSFDQTVELISLLERNGLLRSDGNSAASAKCRGPVKSKVEKAAKVTGKTRKRKGGLSKKILGFLSTKGKSGAHVKQIVEAIRAPQSSVSVWFYSTGKKFLKSGEIKKVAPATFAYRKPEKSN